MTVSKKIAAKLVECQPLLKKKDFAGIYSNFITYDKSIVTKIFQDIGVEPLHYFIHTIPQYSYYNNFNLNYVVLPNTIQVVERGAFSTSGVRYVKFNRGLKTIEQSAFENCNIEEMTLSPTVEMLARYAFYENSLLTKVDLQLASNLQYIGVNCFEGCENLGYVCLPNLPTTTVIGTRAFADCGANCGGLKVRYGGTIASFKALCNDGKQFDAGTVVYCTDGNIVLKE